MNYNQLGFKKIKIFSQNTTKIVLSEVARVFKHNGSLKNLDTKVNEIYESNPMQAGIYYDYLNQSSTLQKLFLQDKFMKYCGKLLKKKRIQDLTFNNFQFLIMLPHRNENNLGWHQDSSYFLHTKKPNTSLVTWTSFSCNKNIDGNIEIIPSSHINGYITHKKNIFKKRKKVSLLERGINFINQKNIKSLNKPKVIKTYSAETLFMDSNIVHRTSSTPKKNIRYTIITRHKIIP